uniref:Auxin response factor n=2 Tax=Anthurium amnicola TaxID=1678845 RepID=A0A1D1Y309_9ARAE
MSQQTPTQELVARDLHGFEWRFKHIYRGHPRRHLLTTGWSTFTTSKRLLAGDAFVFMRGENGELRVGVRRHGRRRSTMPASVISSQNMHLGVLATASHAVMTQTLFTVYYKPRTSQFIISLNKYLEAVKKVFFVGMRFMMRFEGEDSPEKRFAGTIVDVGDISSQWADSKWKFFKVQWDEATPIQRPDRVSPWEIEPFGISTPYLNTPEAVVIDAKRPRSTRKLPILDAASHFWYPGATQSHGVDKIVSDEAQLWKTQIVWPLTSVETNGGSAMSSPSFCNIRGMDCWLQNSLKSSSHSLEDVSPKIFEDANGGDDRNPLLPLQSTGFVAEEAPHPLKNGTEKSTKTQATGAYRLFGIELVCNSNTKTPMKNVASSTVHVPSGTTVGEPAHGDATVSVSAGDTDQQSGLSKAFREQKPAIPKGTQSHKPNSSTRSRIKVHMQGTAVGRALDLTVLDGYEELVSELEQLFKIEGELRGRGKWEVVFTDDEGDMMLLGDDPWPEFCKKVKKLFICTREEVKKMRPRNNFPPLPTRG